MDKRLDRVRIRKRRRPNHGAFMLTSFAIRSSRQIAVEPRGTPICQSRGGGIPTGVCIQSCAIARCASTTVRWTPW